MSLSLSIITDLRCEITTAAVILFIFVMHQIGVVLDILKSNILLYSCHGFLSKDWE